MIRRMILTLCWVTLVSSSASADWDPGDGHKMHWPQRPDYLGTDIAMTGVPDFPANPLADDFLCTKSGPVTDIHFWASVKEGQAIGRIDHIRLTIHDDIPAADSPTGYSIPGDVVWTWDALAGDYQTRPVSSNGWQGWFDPISGGYNRPDHMGFHQFNVDIPEALAFDQEEGSIYWLDIWVVYELNQMIGTGPLGWKTALLDDHWNDYAVYWDSSQQQWFVLVDPRYDVSYDLAFVITPEPTTAGLLTLGGLVGLIHRRRKYNRPRSCNGPSCCLQDFGAEIAGR